jgi:hypothetical protein
VITTKQIFKKEYDPFTMRSSTQATRNRITIPSDGWYQISYYLHHPTRNISGTDNQDGLGWFTIGLRFDTTARWEYTYQDGNMNTPDTCNYIATLYFNANDTFYFTYQVDNPGMFSNSEDEDFLVRISIVKMAEQP